MDDEDDDVVVTGKQRLYPSLSSSSSSITAVATTRRSAVRTVTAATAASPQETRNAHIERLLEEHGCWSDEHRARLEEEGEIVVIPTEESWISETGRRTTELVRQRCISADAIRELNMSRLGLLRHRVSRTLDPYTETIPTVADFMKAGKSLRDALANYPNEYGTWAELLNRGFRLEHFTRDRWWDVTILREHYKVSWEMLRRDISLTAQHLFEQKATCSELVQLNIDTKALIDMGMDKQTFMSFPFSLLADWKKTLRLKKEYMLNDLHMFAEDFAWLVQYHHWQWDTLIQNLNMSMAELNRSSTYTEAAPVMVQHQHHPMPQQQQQQQHQHHYQRTYAAHPPPIPLAQQQYRAIPPAYSSLEAYPKVISASNPMVDLSL